MAQMTPDAGPVINDSTVAEPLIYQALKQTLDDSFIVIHSLPWIGSAVAELTGKNAPTGEIDFLVLHCQLGILAIECKGGWVKYSHPSFVVTRTGKAINPFDQLKRGVYVLPKWVVGGGGPWIRVGYAFAFPDSEMHGKALPPLLVDNTTYPSQNFIIDRSDIINLGERITSIMKYWKSVLRSRNYTTDEISSIVKLICPIEDYRPSWTTRINIDNNRWLILTPEQVYQLDRIRNSDRSIITGRSGTGKTLIALRYARESIENERETLFLVYNRALANRIKQDLSGTSVFVYTFHELCRIAYKFLKQHAPSSQDTTPEWYHVEGPDKLDEATKKGFLDKFGTLIIDEAQVYGDGWLSILAEAFNDKRVLICCDDTQVFPFELSTPTDLIEEIFKASVQELTVNMRSPKTVFDRIRQALPESRYQQYSPRNHEEDSLVEIVSPTPETQLIQTLQDLQESNIDKSHIVLLYAGNEKVISNEVKLLVGSSMPISKYRGLESPIVIVYIADTNSSSIDTATLACAYARATTRCIVIMPLNIFIDPETISYDRVSPNQTDMTLFNQLKKDGFINAQIDLIWPPLRNLRLTSILDETAEQGIKIDWCHNWGGWLFYKQSDSIEVNFWLYHILTTYPIKAYQVYFDTFNRLVVYHGPVKNISDDIDKQRLVVNWCGKCKLWTRHRKNVNAIINCLECNKDIEMQDVPSQYTEIIRNALMVYDPSNFTEDEKKELSLYLNVIILWKNLSTENKSFVKNHYSDASPLYAATKMLLGIHIMQMNVGDILTLDTISDKYYQSIPWLQTRISRELWNKIIAQVLNSWVMHKWLERQKPSLLYKKQTIAM